MNHDTSITNARKTSASSRYSTSPSKTQLPICGRAISWIPKAPRVTLRRLRNTLKR